jgi:hypothetical protein
MMKKINTCLFKKQFIFKNMLFNVYHKKTEKLVQYLTHNTTDREDLGSIIRCNFKGHEFTFEFLDFPDYSNPNAYHIIIKQFAFPSKVNKDTSFFLNVHDKYWDIIEKGYPNNIEDEYDIIIDNIDLSKKWVLLWSHGENAFARIGYDTWSTSSEMQKLSKLTNSTYFFIDNVESSDTYSINHFGLDFKVKETLTQDIYLWNMIAHIRWAYEFKDIFKNLTPEYQFCLALRNPKPHRLEMFRELDSLNNSNVYLSQYDLLFDENKGKVVAHFPEITWDWYRDELNKLKNLNWNREVDETDDFANLNIVGNRDVSRFEHDYYFRILPKAKIQILEETQSHQSDYKIPQCLSEKTYLLLLANIPFISTHHYPLDIIKKIILDIPHPYYSEIKSFDTDKSKLKDFIQKFSDNFDEMYPPLRDYTQKVHDALMYKINTDNSLLSNMLNLL